MMCNRCMLVSRSEIATTKEGEPIAMATTNVGPAATILNGEALCLRHWLDSTEPNGNGHS